MCVSLSDRIRRGVQRLSRRKALFLLLFLGAILLFLGTYGGGCARERGEAVEDNNGVAAMESELEDILSRVRGVGDVRVAITLACEGEYTYSGSHMTSSTPPRVLGVAVVCDGGRSDSVRAEVTALVSSLYSIGANRIHVSPMR